eukprot:Clim_evm37s251 gene=Clim_evmTU37s251
MAADGQLNGAEDSRVVQVRLVTNDPQHKITDKPITVPVTLHRPGLNELTNFLLGYETHKEFDFAVRTSTDSIAELLRTSIDEFLEANNMGLDAIHVVEFFEAFPDALPERVGKTEEWVSSIASAPHGIITSDYSSGLTLWDGSLKKMTAVITHDDVPCKSVTAWQPTGDQYYIAAMGYMDASLTCYRVDPHASAVQACKRLVGHEGTVSGVAVNAAGNLLVSAGHDRMVKIWRLSEVNDAADAMGDAGTQKAKRPKQSKARADAVSALAPELTMGSHVNSVNAVVWSMDQKSVVSGGEDNTVRIFEASTGTNLTSVPFPAPVTSVDCSYASGLIGASCFDNCVRVIDPRATSTVVMSRSSLAGHTQPVVDLSWSPKSSSHLASVSLDGSLRVWDIRSTQPLQTVQDEDDARLLAVFWNEKHGIVTGSSTGTVRSYGFEQ